MKARFTLLIIAALLWPLATLDAQVGSNLISCWTMDESSDGSAGVTRNDSSANALHLTDVSPFAASGTGKVSNAVDLEMSNVEYLSRADNADLSIGGDVSFTITAWVNLESKPASNMAIVGKYATTSATGEYILRWDTTPDRFSWTVSTGAASTAVNATTLGAPSTGTWYFIAVRHDATNNLIRISGNGGAANTAAYSSTVPDTATEFRIGNSSQAGTNVFDGLIDEVAFWKTHLSDAEITDLYNGGSGRACSYIVGGGGGGGGSTPKHLQLLGVG
jgi:hypothetical protein